MRLNVSGQAVWSSSDPLVLAVGKGAAIGKKVGAAKLIATFGTTAVELPLSVV